MKFTVPLRVKVSKNKDFILNINNYRNAHHRVLSTAKRNFTDIVLNLDLPRVNYTRIKVHYYIYPHSKRLYDGNNVVSIIDKFLMDGLIKRGIIRDDNIRYVECPTWTPMPPDRNNPRCEVVIEDKSKVVCRVLKRLAKIYKNK